MNTFYYSIEEDEFSASKPTSAYIIIKTNKSLVDFISWFMFYVEKGISIEGAINKAK